MRGVLVQRPECLVLIGKKRGELHGGEDAINIVGEVGDGAG